MRVAIIAAATRTKRPNWTEEAALERLEGVEDGRAMALVSFWYSFSTAC